MGKYLKLLGLFCLNIAMVELSAFEWNFNSNVGGQSGKEATPPTSPDRWVTGQGRFWEEQYWRAGDFNGDGVDDLVRVFKDDRDVSIDVYLSDKKSFKITNWALRQGRFWDEQDWLAGDFDGNGVDDLARVFQDGRNVSIDVYLSNKKGFTMKRWVSQEGRFWDEQHWRAGDFDGDGADDLARIFRDDRDVSIDVYRSSKTGFIFRNWLQRQGRFLDEQHWRAGDFNGDGTDDLARVFKDGRNVSIDVYRSSKKGFTMKRWVSQEGRFWDEQHWRAGDFDGDGADDLARIFRDGRNVSIDVYRSGKDSFTMKNRVQQQGRFWDNQHWRAGDFDGDKTDDIARAFKDDRNVSIDVYLSGN